MLDHLYELPEEKRRGVALVCALVATVLIVGAWFVGFIEPLSGARRADVGAVGTSAQSVTNTLSPLRALSESFRALTRGVRSELGGALWGIGGQNDEKKDEGAGSGVSIVEDRAPTFNAPMSSSTPEEKVKIDEQTKNENLNEESGE